MTYDYNAAQPRAKVKRTDSSVQPPKPDVKPQKPQEKQPKVIFDKEALDEMQHQKLDPFDMDDDGTDFPFIDFKNKK